MEKLVAANWKMNPNSQKEAEEIFSALGEQVLKLKETEVVIFPPYLYLPVLKNFSLPISLGAQNVFFEEKGAFTGEISAPMLKSFGAEYVIIGHSERRKYFGETNETINKKIKKSLAVGLKVILCVGETAEEREKKEKDFVLEKQLTVGLDGIESLDNVDIAYEPVWAIGTGNNCGVEETEESIDFVSNFVNPDTRILYGGSVKSENSGDYIKKAGADGLLVGGASLNPEEFIKIIKSVE